MDQQMDKMLDEEVDKIIKHPHMSKEKALILTNEVLGDLLD